MATRDPYSRGDQTTTPGTSSTPAGTSGSSATGTMHGDPARSTSTSGTTGSGTTTDDTKQAATQVADQAKQALGQAADQAQQQAKSMLGGQLDQASSGLSDVAEAVRSVGKQLRQKDQPQLASLTDQAARQIDHLSGYMRDRDVDDYIDDLESFARRQPMLFVGGAFFLGLLTARFLKSSRPEPAMDYRRSAAMQPYRSGYYPRGRYGAGRAGYGYQTGMGGTGYQQYGRGATGYGSAGSGGQRYVRQTEQSNVGSSPMHSGTGTTGTTHADMAGVGSRTGTTSPSTTGGTIGSSSASTPSGQRTASGTTSPSTSGGWGTSGSSSTSGSSAGGTSRPFAETTQTNTTEETRQSGSSKS